MTGFSATDLSIAAIVLFSPSRPLKLVAAIAIYSPATQSTAALNLIVVAPGSAVSLSTVHVGVLCTPCISRVLCFTAIHLFPKIGRYGDEMLPCMVIVSYEV